MPLANASIVSLDTWITLASSRMTTKIIFLNTQTAA
jgi:hypothetical protein